MMQDRDDWITKILPVVLPGHSIDEIPEFLLPYSSTRYVIEHLTPDGTIALRRTLTGQPRHPMPPLGPAPEPLPPEDISTTTRISPPPGKGGAGSRTVHIESSRVGKVIMGDYHGGKT
jgi:hypothetical protein